MLLEGRPQVGLDVQDRHPSRRASLLEEQLQVVEVRGHRRAVDQVGFDAADSPIDTPGLDWNNW